MTLIIEISKPFQARPGLFRSGIMTRVWWLYFAFAILHIPLPKYRGMIVNGEVDWVD